jgi:regulator of protease activity HflC (stomatin/prohibitin superfamily)
MSDFLTFITYGIAIIAGALIVFNLAIKIVREYQRLVVFRLGKSIGRKGPGIVWLWPIVDRPVWVDLREAFLEIPSQTCITRDNAPINVDFLMYWKVIDPELTVIQVGDFAGAARGSGRGQTRGARA